MRQFISILETVTPTLFHGSTILFTKGTVLRPQSGGYVDHPDAEPQHHMTEEILERFRPENCIPRSKAVFMVDNPDLIDYAGGYTDHIYEVEPVGEVTKGNLAWYSELYALCEDAVLSESAETPEMEQAARSYWNASPKDSRHDLYEYMASSAIVIHEID